MSSNTTSIIVVQLLSHVQLFVTPWTAIRQASLSFIISLNFLKLISIESVMPSSHLILCRPFLLLHSIIPSIRVFSNELYLCIRWPKYWSFSFSISPSNEYSELIPLELTSLTSLVSQELSRVCVRNYTLSTHSFTVANYFIIFSMLYVTCILYVS